MIVLLSFGISIRQFYFCTWWNVSFETKRTAVISNYHRSIRLNIWMCNKMFLLHVFLLQGVSVGTINTKANVCCVQFPADSSNSLAFGSADHKIYYYDLRNSKMPLCTLVGHNKTVSYVKFIDSTNLVSASTDNTLKLWDLSMCSSRVLDCPLQSFTGHMNVKVYLFFPINSSKLSFHRIIYLHYLVVKRIAKPAKNKWG